MNSFYSKLFGNNWVPSYFDNHPASVSKEPPFSIYGGSDNEISAELYILQSEYNIKYFEHKISKSTNKKSIEKYKKKIKYHQDKIEKLTIEYAEELI